MPRIGAEGGLQGWPEPPEGVSLEPRGGGGAVASGVGGLVLHALANVTFMTMLVKKVL